MLRALAFAVALATFTPAFAEKRRPRDSGDIDSGITIPHIAAGGGWSSEFQCFNLENTQQPYILSFFDSSGNSMAIDLFEVDGTFIGRQSTVAGVLAPGGIRFVQWQQNGSLRTGYASLDSDNFLEVACNVVLSDDSPDRSRPIYQASVPSLGRFQDHIRFPFVNSGGFASTLAWKSDAQQGVTMIARDGAGRELCRWAGQLVDERHEAFVIRERLPCTADRDGLIEVQTDFVGLTAIAFLFHPEGAFTTQIPFSICCLD